MKAPHAAFKETQSSERTIEPGLESPGSFQYSDELYELHAKAVRARYKARRRSWLALTAALALGSAALYLMADVLRALIA
jgi:hypothetical protein